jgi:hypothetical protein
MRAKSVNENIAFNRGRDPKETLELGEYRPEKLREKILQMGPGIAAQTDMGWAVTQNRHGSPIEWNYQFLDALIPEGIKTLYSQMMEVLKQNESLDFERGNDPKKTMGIGLSQYSLANMKERDKSDNILNNAIAEEMELPKDAIFFMGDTRGHGNATYLDKLSDFVYNSDRVKDRDLAWTDSTNYTWTYTLEVFETEAGKILYLEGEGYGQFYGTLDAFSYMNTRKYL